MAAAPAPASGMSSPPAPVYGRVPVACSASAAGASVVGASVVGVSVVVVVVGGAARSKFRTWAFWPVVMQPHWPL